MKSFSLLFFTICFFVLSPSLFAQENTFKDIFIEAKNNNQEVVVTLKNNSTFTGKVITVDDSSAGVETKDGLFNFNYDRIKEVKIVDVNDVTSGWYKNPSENKLFISQTGKMLESKSGFYQNTLLFFSNFAYGISNHISVDLGFSMIPGLGAENQLFSAGLKTGTSLNEKFDVSVSAKHYRLFDNDIGVTSLSGSITYSSKHIDLTAGSGFGIAEGTSSNPLVILGGQLRVSQRFALLSENLILPSEDDVVPLVSFGGRIINTRSVFDIGFFTSEDIDALIPFVSYTVKL